jgi:DMSO/TMAO reductase YedYZ molybdopterin-dependent catalytic subunit
MNMPRRTAIATIVQWFPVLQAIEVTHVFPGGFWEDQGYDWFSGV